MKTTFESWWESLPPAKRDKRLETVLYRLANRLNDPSLFPFQYVEDITEDRFLQLRNMGVRSWEVLKALLQEFPVESKESNRKIMRSFSREVETLLEYKTDDESYERDLWLKIDEYLKMLQL